MQIAELPLHSGKAPKWLFERMKKLGGAIAEAIVLEFGKEELVKRLSDALWFQALACTLGFDWHSSGSTTVTMGALKEALKEKEIGIKIAGRKGKLREIPKEIEKFGNEIGLSDGKIEKIKRASKLSAKADSIGLIDGFSIYYHAIIFSENGKWSVVQQGMRGEWARRYHLSNVKSFEEEPNSSIASEKIVKPINLLSKESREARKAIVDLINEAPKLRGYFTGQTTLDGYYIKLPKSHRFNKRIYKEILKAYEKSPSNFEEVMEERLGETSIRALSLISELIYNVKASRKDPVKFSFAHGGKDGIPYPIRIKEYDKSIEILESAIESAEIGKREKIEALKRLSAKFNY